MKKLLKFPLVLCVIAYARSFPQPLITQLPAPIPSNGTSSLNLTSISALDSDLKRVATMGILFGAVQGEAEMERKLTHQLADLVQTFNVSRPEVKSRKVAALERSMERDKVALGILGGALELATKKTMTYDQYRKEMQKLAEHQKFSSGINLIQKSPTNLNPNQTELNLRQIRRDVNHHINQMRRDLGAKVKQTVQHLERDDGLHNMIGQVDTAAIKKSMAMNKLPDYSFYDTLVQRDLENHIDALFRRRQDDDDDDGDGDAGKNSKENGDGQGVSVTLGDGDESESESEEEAPGGLVGLIAGLSGGDEGSDVGALIGTLSAAVTNIFGPGGLDVPGLLGTGAGLLAGLLGGDENFGKVLGSYVGITIEGFSGGGADNNGAFFGNFLGSVIAALSSDPDDEDAPLKPKLFIENFFTGLQDAKRKGDPPMEDMHKGGSDFFGFIGNIVGSVVGGVTSLILNASLGSSGGSSQGSADASGASSAGSSADDPCKHPCATTL
ncbi:uncharacterized protein LOC120413640 [Culex pipiens pallens]|uniref:uncharacterized protein LOC120413640 n=1 Tax=Culex pipiens pallens TaxID=42434 RepID=UPI00195414FE|nr:uncharacterized protein LOC120413640 [Culex pipiens pallens]